LLMGVNYIVSQLMPQPDNKNVHAEKVNRAIQLHLIVPHAQLMLEDVHQLKF
jgi:hypothetical protein